MKTLPYLTANVCVAVMLESLAAQAAYAQITATFNRASAFNTGTLTLNAPTGVALDSAGTLYIADPGSNDNIISATGQSTLGGSITLGSQTYYSDTTNPFAINARLGLNRRRQAFALTTGWGNMIPRAGGHWSFPFEAMVHRGRGYRSLNSPFLEAQRLSATKTHCVAFQKAA